MINQCCLFFFSVIKIEGVWQDSYQYVTYSWPQKLSFLFVHQVYLYPNSIMAISLTSILLFTPAMVFKIS